MTSETHWKRRCADVEAKLRLMEAQQEGYDRLLERLTRERDAANIQAVAVSKAWANRADEVHALEREVRRLEETAHEADALKGQLQRTQEWMERWQAAAAEEGLKRHEADLKVAELERQLLDLRTQPAGDREWMRQFAVQVVEFLEDLHDEDRFAFDHGTQRRITVLLGLARQTRERGETANAAGPNPAEATPGGSNPPAPTYRTMADLADVIQGMVEKAAPGFNRGDRAAASYLLNHLDTCRHGGEVVSDGGGRWGAPPTPAPGRREAGRPRRRETWRPVINDDGRP